MILCSCNMLTDRDVKASVKPCGRRADRARDVFHSKGCQPKCGRCIKNIHAICNRECAKVAVSHSAGWDSPLPSNEFAGR
jgi:bacterioferritin-associated ferredoxin